MHCRKSERPANKGMKMPVLKKLGVIVLFAYSVRSLLGACARFAGASDLAYVQPLITCIFYVILFYATVTVLHPDLSRMFSIPKGRGAGPRLLLALSAGLFLYAFARGQNAVEVVLVAQFDRNLAYAFWKFYPAADEAPPFFSLMNLARLLPFFLLGPIVEEFLVRGVLFPALVARRGIFVSAVLTSLIFTAFHLQNEFYLACFVFSFFLCYLYATTNSLFLCMLVHCTYNFIAYVITNYFDTHLIRPIAEIDSIKYWIPELCMWSFSIFVLITLWCRRRQRGPSGANQMAVAGKLTAVMKRP